MIRRNKEVQSLLILWGATLISCIIIYFNFIFGNEFFVFKDVGSDTFQQYLMHYNSIINSMRDGTLSSWDFTNGFGTSIYALNFFHPLLFLLYLAGVVLGPMRLPHLMVFLIIGQIFLAVTVLFFFLKEFSFTRKSRIIAAYIYGFNAFLIVWGQHYQFGVYAILFPLLLLLLERALKRRRFSFWLTLAIAITVMASTYMSYMTLITVGIYLVLRLFTFNYPLKERMVLFFKNCSSILLGIGLVAIVFVPSALYLSSISSRLEFSASLLNRFLENLAPYNNPYYHTLFYRLFSSNLHGIYDNYTGYWNYYESPLLFLSGLFIILFLQYLFTIHRQMHPLRIKLVQYIALLVAAFLLLLKSGSMIYNAFAYAFSRHTFIFMPFACLIIALTLDQIFIKKLFSYLGLAIATALFAFLFVIHSGTIQASPAIICALGVAMVIVLVLIHHKRSRLPQLALTILLFVLVMTNSIYDSYNSTNNRDTLKKDDAKYFDRLYGENINSALEYLHSIDNSFYRIENTEEGVTRSMDSLAQNYFSVSTYNSTLNKNAIEFVETLWPNLVQLTPTYYSYDSAVYDAELASLLNIKYLLSYNPQLDVDGFVFLKQFGELFLFENTNTNSIGKFFTKVALASEIPEASNLLDIDRLVSEVLILDEEDYNHSTYEKVSLADYALTKSDYQLDSYSFSETEDFTIDIDRNKLVDYERVYLDFDITLEQSSVISVLLNDSSIHYADVKAGESTHLSLRLPASSTSFRISQTNTPISGKIENISFYHPTNPITRLEPNVLNFDAPGKNSTITGSINSSIDGLLMLAIPYENGWHAYINGEETKIMRSDYGFIALDITTGQHDITLKYKPDGLQLGTIISISSLVIFVFLWSLQRYRNKVDKTTEHFV